LISKLRTICAPFGFLHDYNQPGDERIDEVKGRGDERVEVGLEGRVESVEMGCLLFY